MGPKVWGDSKLRPPPRSSQKREEAGWRTGAQRAAGNPWGFWQRPHLPARGIAGISWAFAQVGEVGKAPGCNGGLRCGAIDRGPPSKGGWGADPSGRETGSHAGLPPHQAPSHLRTLAPAIPPPGMPLLHKASTCPSSPPSGSSNICFLETCPASLSKIHLPQ